MGFYASQYVFTQLPGGLSTAQICIMQRAAWSCLDETGFLDRPKQWLGDKCGISLRSMERHLPQLAKLEQLVQGDSGFRLPRFLAYHRQIGGADLQFVRQFVRQIGGAYKEGFPLIPFESPLPPASGGKLSRAERRRIEALGVERSPLHEFVVAWCEVCLVPHEWPVREPYVDTAVREMACPDWRSKLVSPAKVES
jgi:hypothetical protein